MAIRSLLRSQITNAEWYDSFLAGNISSAVGAYDLLETTILDSDTSSVSFTGLGAYSGYKHLQLRMVARASDTNATLITVNLNSDTSSSHFTHGLIGNGSNVDTQVTGSTRNDYWAGERANSGMTANNYSAHIMDILDFSSTTKNTTVRTLSGVVDSSRSRIRLDSGLFFKTEAITSVQIKGNPGFAAGSRFSLYGMGTPELAGA